MIAEAVNDITNCPQLQSATYSPDDQTLWDIPLSCGTVYNKETLKGIFIEGLPKSMQLSMSHPWITKKHCSQWAAGQTCRLISPFSTWNEMRIAPRRCQDFPLTQPIAEIDVQRTLLCKCQAFFVKLRYTQKWSRQSHLPEQRWKATFVNGIHFRRVLDTRRCTIFPRSLAVNLRYVGMPVHFEPRWAHSDTIGRGKTNLRPEGVQPFLLSEWQPKTVSLALFCSARPEPIEPVCPTSAK